MAELPNNENIDLETLQSQIDLSLAHTKNLVSSWLRPVQGTLPSSSRKADQDKEIEELLRRPPRLGVGAPTPASTSAFAVEGVKLKNKLTGKKRPRIVDDAGTRLQDPDSEDEDEARRRAVRKIVKLDPFESTHVKKRKRKGSLEETVTGPEHYDTSVDDVLIIPNMNSRPPESPAPPLLQNVLSQRKKKKKKHKVRESDLLSDLPIISPLEQHDAATSVHSSQMVPQEYEKAPAPDPLAHELHPVPLSTKKTSPSPTKLKKTVFPTTVPILNLNGPPLDDGEGGPAPSAKRKRRKRSRRKSRVETSRAASNATPGT